MGHKIPYAAEKNITAAYDKAVAVGHIKTKGKKKAAKKATASKATAADAGGSKVSSKRSVVVAGADDNHDAKDGFEHDDHDTGLQAAYDAEEFLRTRAATKLSDSQKKTWKEVVENMVKLLAGIGVKISTRA